MKIKPNIVFNQTQMDLGKKIFVLNSRTLCIWFHFFFFFFFKDTSPQKRQSKCFLLGFFFYYFVRVKNPDQINLMNF